MNYPTLRKSCIAFAVTTLLTASISVAQTLLPAENSAIREAQQGVVVKLPGFMAGEKQIPLLSYEKTVMPGPQFIISDDPEYIRVPEAIALKEKVEPGAVRLYLYNVNGIKAPAKMDRKITVLIRNLGSQPLHMRMLKRSLQKPSTNYFEVGKEAMAGYYAAKPENTIRTIKPGQAVPLDGQLEKNIVKYDELVHGIYEFVVDQPAEINVVQTDPRTPGVKALNTIETVLAPKSHSGAGRGLYGVSNYQIKLNDVYDADKGAGQIMFADGTVDPWIRGTENSTGQDVKDVGNYGVMYHVRLKWKSSGKKGLALVTWSARCGAMSATMIASKGKFGPGVIRLPSDQLVTKGGPEVVLVQLFLPAKNGEEQTIDLTYSPPAASCLPTPLILIPVDLN